MRRLLLVGAAGVAATVAIRSRRESIDGEVALVTGGSHGLGLEIARELARAGCSVAICARNENDLRWAEGELQRDGARVLALPCDVSDRDQVRSLVAAVESSWGPIGIVVNNAGIIQVAPLASATPDDFRQAMDVMFWGPLNVTLAVLDGMRSRRRGRLVNITSIGGKIAVPHLVPYATAKFAAVGLSQGLAAELARDGVKVTTVVPGLMRTGSHLNAVFKGDRRREYSWFAAAATLPVLAIDARRAARRIVRAMRRGAPEVNVSATSWIATRLHGILPGTSARALSVVNRLLPDAGAEPGLAGADTRSEAGSPLARAAATFGRAAVGRHQPPRVR